MFPFAYKIYNVLCVPKDERFKLYVEIYNVPWRSVVQLYSASSAVKKYITDNCYDICVSNVKVNLSGMHGIYIVLHYEVFAMQCVSAESVKRSK